MFIEYLMHVITAAKSKLKCLKIMNDVIRTREVLFKKLTQSDVQCLVRLVTPKLNVNSIRNTDNQITMNFIFMQQNWIV